MMRALVLVLIAALAMAGVPAFAAVTAARAAEDDRARLVELLLPEPTLVDLAVRSVAAGVEAPDLAGPELTGLVAAHPDLRAHLATAMRPRFATLIRRELPDFREEMRAILVTELTDAEAAEAHGFFASATGVRLLAAAYGAILENPTRTEAQQQEAAMNAVMRALRPADFSPFLTFASSSAAQKVARIHPRVVTASRAWSERMVDKHADRLRKDMLREARDFAERQERNVQ